ncbi:MAG: Holliday junction branch migration protein RuvA [Clostridiaceae bacterium]|nr:Holliday junction branch migration protein RuvA [Clostridiaceae bacterium]
MFAYIKGILEIKTKGYIVIDVNGIGYKIFMSETAISKVGEIGNTIKVHTYLKVREDEMSLYGFNTNEELRMFELLLSVSGIGAKSAISILSNINPSGFALAIITNDVSKIKSLPGIGPKSAQRIILELKDKVEAEEKSADNNKTNEELNTKEETKFLEAISALQVLGYSRKEIDKALENIDKEELNVEDIIRKALKNLAR